MDFVFLSRKKLLIILESQILPFKEIFKKKIFRIPDYQRGYSWEQTQLEDLWADLSNIHLHAYHFTGILTINNFSEQDYESLEREGFQNLVNREQGVVAINGEFYTPHNLVDGQQRLTTILILLSQLIKKIKNEAERLQFSRQYFFMYDNGNKYQEILSILENHNQEDNIFDLDSENPKCGLIFTPYVLIEAKKLVSIFDRLCSLFMSKEKIDLIHDYAVRSHQIFGQFIYGKFLDSLIIGIIAFIGLAILKVKFFPILAVFILITNMIPYFGPFIGGFPAVLVALMTGDLFHALAVLVFVFALQQFDGLFLGPKILGDVVGISPFWVLLSITVFGHFFGFIGMFLGVPMICVIRMLFNDIIDFRNKMKELDT